MATTNISPVTALMVGAYDDSKMILPSKGFSTFFARGNASTTYVTDSESVNYDIVRGGKKISKLLTRENAARSLGSVQKATVAMKFQNTSFVFPSITETASADWNQTLKRVAGEAPYGNLTRFDRLRILLVRAAMEDMRRIQGRIEKMSAEVLTTGGITLDDAQTYAFGRATTNTFAAPLVWTNAAATPLVDIDNLATVVAQNGKMPINFLVMGRDVVSAFLDNPSVKNLADNRRYYFVEAGSERSIAALPANLSWMLGAGFNHLGNIRTPEGRDLPIFNYLEQYQTDAGTWTDYMNPKAVFGGYSDAETARYFGPSLTIPPSRSEQMEMMEKLGISLPQVSELPMGTEGVLNPAMFNWDFDIPEGAQTGVYLRTHVSPLYVPTAIDQFGLITGVVA